MVGVMADTSHSWMELVRKSFELKAMGGLLLARKAAAARAVLQTLRENCRGEIHASWAEARLQLLAKVAGLQGAMQSMQGECDDAKGLLWRAVVMQSQRAVAMWARQLWTQHDSEGEGRALRQLQSSWQVAGNMCRSTASC